MPVPIVSNEFWPLMGAVFAGGAVIVVLLMVAIALLTRDSRPTPRHRAPVAPPSAAAEVSVDEHVLV